MTQDDSRRPKVAVPVQPCLIELWKRRWRDASRACGVCTAEFGRWYYEGGAPPERLPADEVLVRFTRYMKVFIVCAKAMDKFVKAEEARGPRPGHTRTVQTGTEGGGWNPQLRV